MAAGYVPVTMGDNRLRTETAALVACDTCHIINQMSL
jgi:16S rRNA U1498 N3-methylase RsmE